MSDREEDRDQGVEDLFGDLDEFFAPIENVDWPEEGSSEESSEGGRPETPSREEEAPSREEEAPSREEEEPQAEEPDGEWSSPGIDLPPEEELLAGAEPGAREEPGPSPSPSAAPGSEEPEIEPQKAEDEPDASDFFAPRPQGDDEAALFGDELEQRAEEPAAEEPATEEPSGELSADDLVAGTPPVYGDLDAGDEEEDQPFVEEPVLEEEATFAGETEEPSPTASAEEPEDLEDAAAHFASGLDADEVERDLLSDLTAKPAEEQADALAAAETGPVDRETPSVLEGGPTWQEPAAHDLAAQTEEEAGPLPPSGRRNLPAAVASALILGVAAIALLAIGKGPFVVLAIGLVLLGQGELYAVMRRRGLQPATALGLIAGLFIMAGAYIKGDSGQGEAAMLLGLAIGITLSVLWYMAASPTARRGTVQNVGATVLGIVYVPFLMSFGLLLLAIPGNIGRNLLLTVIGLTALYDVSAYAIGTLWGNRPLAPTVSPRKSWEGAIGATFVLLLVALAIVPSIDPFTAARAVGLAIVIAVAAPLGDLVESAIKRDLRVKDMGSILPGHGGILDRIDAILFTAPVAYYYVRLVLIS